jgi:hypothetical protein
VPGGTTTTVPQVAGSAATTPRESAAAAQALLGRRDFPGAGWVSVPRTDTTALDEMAGVLDGAMTCAGAGTLPAPAATGQSGDFAGVLVRNAPVAASYTFVYAQPVADPLPLRSPSTALGRCAAAALDAAYARTLETTRTVTRFRATVDALPPAARRAGVRGFELQTSYLARPAEHAPTVVHSVFAVLGRGPVLSVLNTFAGRQPFDPAQLRQLLEHLTARLAGAAATLPGPVTGTGPPAGG